MYSHEDSSTRQYVRKLLRSSQFSFITKLVKKFPKAEMYLVGGALRDIIIGRNTKDYDFVVRNVSLKDLEKYLSRLGSVNFVGRTFGVLKFSPAVKKGVKKVTSEPFDIALPRKEYSIGNSGHYRDFKVTSDHRLSIRHDLSRRDFTINAIAYDLRKYRIVDPWNGVEDIHAKIIRTVGAPAERFQEDYSRMLRAIRFSCQLGFTIEDRTVRAIHAGIKHLNKSMKATEALGSKSDANSIRVVPFEIVAREIIRAFSAHCVKAFDLCDTFGVITQLIPELLTMKKCPQPNEWHSEGDVWTHTRLALTYLLSKEFYHEFHTKTLESTLILAVLFHDIGKPYALRTPEKHGVDRVRFDGHDRIGGEMTKKILERLRVSSVSGTHIHPDEVAWLIHYHLLLLNSDVSAMKHNTIEKYFFKNQSLGMMLRKLIFVDSLASVRADGGSTLGNYRALGERLKQFGSSQVKRLPKPLITGDDVMGILGIKPGKDVGVYLEQVREEQLSKRINTKKGAFLFLKKVARKK